MPVSSLSSNLHNNVLNDTNFIQQWSFNPVPARRVSVHFQTRAAFKVLNLSHNRRDNVPFIVKSFESNSTVAIPEETRVLEDDTSPIIDNGGSDDGNGNFPPDNGGNDGGGGGDGEGDDEEGKEFGAIMKFDDVMRETEKYGATLPSDILEAAKTTGIRELILMRYLELQGSVGPLRFLMRHCAMLRNRMLADPAFLFKIGTEIVIDSCCATFAEVQKRGKDFWAEFELYLADLLVGVVVNVALVGMLAPYVRIGKRSASAGFLGGFRRACRDLPSSAIAVMGPLLHLVDYWPKVEASQIYPQFMYTLNWFLGVPIRSGLCSLCRWAYPEGVLQGAVGFGCGIFGQGIANLIMTAKRSIKKSEEDIPVPPLIKSAVLWGAFLAISSNTRYQIINGLERVVEASPVAKNIPPVAMAFTIGVRFANNVYGGMQFVDWARWSGVQ